MTEIWKEALRWPEYEVSNFGRVRRAQPSPSNKGHAVIGRILSPCNNRGYLVVRLKRPGFARTEKIHQLVCEAFHGPAPTPGMEPNHKDTVRSNNRSDNLEWLTRADNLKHSREVGAGCRKGRRNPQAKLTDADILAIRADDRTQREIAADYGVCQQTISLAKSKVRWSHI